MLHNKTIVRLAIGCVVFGIATLVPFDLSKESAALAHKQHLLNERFDKKWSFRITYDNQDEALLNHEFGSWKLRRRGDEAVSALTSSVEKFVDVLEKIYVFEELSPKDMRDRELREDSLGFLTPLAIVELSGEKKHSLTFSQSTINTNFLFAKIDENPSIFVVTNSILSILSQGPQYFDDNNLFEPNFMRNVSEVSFGSGIKLNRIKIGNNKQRWKIDNGSGIVKDADWTIVEDFFRSFSCKIVHVENKPEISGEVVKFYEYNKSLPVVLTIGDEAPGTNTLFYAKVSSRPSETFTIPATVKDAVSMQPRDFRIKTIFPNKSIDVRKISIEDGHRSLALSKDSNMQWMLSLPYILPAGATEVGEMLDEIIRLSAIDFKNVDDKMWEKKRTINITMELFDSKKMLLELSKTNDMTTQNDLVTVVNKEDGIDDEELIIKPEIYTKLDDIIKNPLVLANKEISSIPTNSICAIMRKSSLDDAQEYVYLNKNGKWVTSSIEGKPNEAVINRFDNGFFTHLTALECVHTALLGEYVNLVVSYKENEELKNLILNIYPTTEERTDYFVTVQGYNVAYKISKEVAEALLQHLLSYRKEANDEDNLTLQSVE